VPTPWQSAFAPFVLRSNIVFFHDWRYVDHGAHAWVDEAGKSYGLWHAQPIPPLRWAGRDVPWGIRLRALPAQKSEPFLHSDQPWEGIIFPPTTLREGGRYRLWYEVVPPDHIDDGRTGEHNFLCYAESDDGVTWHKPRLGRLRYQGHDTNVVYGGPLAEPWGYHGGSVFLDPAATAAERYKAFHLSRISRERLEELRRARPDAVDPFNDRTAKKPWAVCGAVSPDGIDWHPIPEPLVAQFSDTQNIAYYDESLHKYVGYFRTWVMGRRAIGRAETDDFRRFPLPETIIWPGADVGSSDTWYANGRTCYPGAPDYHLMFPKRWKIAEDRFYVHLATSPDGILWTFPPESLILAASEDSGWDAGGVSVGCGMVELPGERVGVAFVGDRIPHKYTRVPPVGQIAWAWWEKGRLVALEAGERGQFHTWPLLFRGSELRLNVRTKHVGEVRIEAVGADGKALSGRSFDDCDPISGDFLDRVVTWRGESHMEHKPDEPLSFRVRLAAAQLFSMRLT